MLNLHNDEGRVFIVHNDEGRVSIGHNNNIGVSIVHPAITRNQQHMRVYI